MTSQDQVIADECVTDVRGGQRPLKQKSLRPQGREEEPGLRNVAGISRWGHSSWEEVAYTRTWRQEDARPACTVPGCSGLALAKVSLGSHEKRSWRWGKSELGSGIWSLNFTVYAIGSQREGFEKGVGCAPPPSRKVIWAHALKDVEPMITRSAETLISFSFLLSSMPEGRAVQCVKRPFLRFSRSWSIQD